MAKSRRSRRPRTTLLILVLASVTIITLDARGGFHRISSGAKSVSADAFAPVKSGVNDIIEPIGSVLAGSVNYGAVRRTRSFRRGGSTLRRRSGGPTWRGCVVFGPGARREGAGGAVEWGVHGCLVRHQSSHSFRAWAGSRQPGRLTSSPGGGSRLSALSAGQALIPTESDPRLFAGPLGPRTGMAR